MISIGHPAPSFTLMSDENKSVSLSDYQGKNIILYFYPKDSTPGCTIESCGFRDAYDAFLQLDAVIIGVSRDSVARHEKFKSKYQLPFPLLADTDGVVCDQYGVLVEKSMFGKKYKGIDRSTFLIDGKGVIQHIWRKVKIRGHVKEVETMLASLA